MAMDILFGNCQLTFDVEGDNTSCFPRQKNNFVRIDAMSGQFDILDHIASPMPRNTKTKTKMLLKLIGSREERQAFVQDLKHVFENEFKDIYHYIVYEPFKEAFVKSCDNFGYKISKFSSQCQLPNGQMLRHYFVCIQNPKGLKRPTKGLTQKIDRVMKQMNVERGVQRKHNVEGKRMMSRVHLLDRILTVMTQKTNCHHNGKISLCRHDDFSTSPVIPDRKILNVFRKREIFPLIPQYQMERREECKKYKKKENEPEPEIQSEQPTLTTKEIILNMDF
jgi:hypothetical protein